MNRSNTSSLVVHWLDSSFGTDQRSVLLFCFSKAPHSCLWCNCTLACPTGLFIPAFCSLRYSNEANAEFLRSLSDSRKITADKTKISPSKFSLQLQRSDAADSRWSSWNVSVLAYLRNESREIFCSRMLFSIGTFIYLLYAARSIYKWSIILNNRVTCVYTFQRARILRHF